MPDPSGASQESCSKLGPAAHRTVAAAIDLVGWTAVHSPQILAKVREEK